MGKLRKGTGGGWLATLTPAQRQRVKDALAARTYSYRSSHNHTPGWSVVLDRSVGVPRSIVLRKRDISGSVLVDIPVDAEPH